MSKSICYTFKYMYVFRGIVTITVECGLDYVKPFGTKKQRGLRKLWFYLIHLVFIFIILQHSHMCPLLFFTERVLITKAWPWRVGPFSTLHDQHKRYHESRLMTWIGDLNVAEERPFLSACWYFDNVFLLGHSGNKLIPSSPTHFC